MRVGAILPCSPGTAGPACGRRCHAYVAVASNFSRAAAEFSPAIRSRDRYPRCASATVRPGKLYAQIINGAPYDVFLAADAERPALLENPGMPLPGHRFTYATGGCRCGLETQEIASRRSTDAAREGCAGQSRDSALWQAAMEFLARAATGSRCRRVPCMAKTSCRPCSLQRPGMPRLASSPDRNFGAAGYPRQPAPGRCPSRIATQGLEQQAVLLRGAANNGDAARFSSSCVRTAAT